MKSTFQNSTLKTLLNNNYTKGSLQCHHQVAKILQRINVIRVNRRLEEIMRGKQKSI